jgi:hypothetical protein
VNLVEAAMTGSTEASVAWSSMLPFVVALLAILWIVRRVDRLVR